MSASLIEQVSSAETPLDRNRRIIAAAIAIAPTCIADALIGETYQSLAALQASPDTHGEYVQAVSDLRSANKRITKGDIEEGIKSIAIEPVSTAGTSELRDGLDPWPEPVDGAVLYEEIRGILKLHSVLPDGAAAAIAVWVMSAYMLECFRVFPKLLIHSPQKRCGKTTLLELLIGLLPRALAGSNVTASVIFRAIQKWRVSIVMDEVDTFLHNSDELRGIVNSGHTRSGAFVWRVEGDTEREPVQYSTWAPTVLAMIGNPPGTILDRSIKIRLQRKTVDDSVLRLPQEFFDSAQPLRQKLERWALDNQRIIATTAPQMPSHNNDRAVDNWTSLFSVSEALGNRSDIEESMRLLEQEDTDNDDLSIELLRDVQQLIQTRRFIDSAFSSVLTDWLTSMDDRPWLECNRGKALTPNRLAFHLKPYGIKPRDIRKGGAVRKGYRVDDFKDAFYRYLSATPLQSSEIDGVRVADSNSVALRNVVNATPVAVSNRNVAVDENETATLRASNDGSCSGVADKSPVLQGTEGEFR